MNPQRFDREVRRLLHDHEVAPPPSDWEAIRAHVSPPAPAPRRRGAWWRWGTPLLLAGFSVAGLSLLGGEPAAEPLSAGSAVASASGPLGAESVADAGGAGASLARGRYTRANGATPSDGAPAATRKFGDDERPGSPSRLEDGPSSPPSTRRANASASDAPHTPTAAAAATVASPIASRPAPLPLRAPAVISPALAPAAMYPDAVSPARRASPGDEAGDRPAGTPAAPAARPARQRPLDSLALATFGPLALSAPQLDYSYPGPGPIAKAPSPWHLSLRGRQAIGVTRRRYLGRGDDGGDAAYLRLRDSAEVAQASLATALLLEATHRSGWFTRAGLEYGFFRQRSRLGTGIDTVVAEQGNGVSAQLRLSEQVAFRQNRLHTLALLVAGGYRREWGPFAGVVFAEAGYEVALATRGQYAAPAIMGTTGAEPAYERVAVDGRDDGEWVARVPGLQLGLGVGLDLALTPRWSLGVDATYRRHGSRSGPADGLEYAEHSWFGGLGARYELR